MKWRHLVIALPVGAVIAVATQAWRTNSEAQSYEEALSRYLTQGADATSVPRGKQPGAAYFSEGADRTSVPTSDEPGAAYFSDGADFTSVPTGDEPGAAYFSDGPDLTSVPTSDEPGADFFSGGADATSVSASGLPLWTPTSQPAEVGEIPSSSVSQPQTSVPLPPMPVEGTTNAMGKETLPTVGQDRAATVSAAQPTLESSGAASGTARRHLSGATDIQRPVITQDSHSPERSAHLVRKGGTRSAPSRTDHTEVFSGPGALFRGARILSALLMTSLALLVAFTGGWAIMRWHRRGQRPLRTKADDSINDRVADPLSQASRPSHKDTGDASGTATRKDHGDGARTRRGRLRALDTGGR